MGLGDGIHEWVLKKLQKIRGLIVMPESGGRVVIDELTKEVSFRVDALVSFDMKLGGFELKTVQGRSFQYMDGPKTDHLLQIMSYMGLNPTIDWFSLVYIARDSGFMQEFHITKEGTGNEAKYFYKGVLPIRPIEEIVGVTFQGIVDRWTSLEKFMLEDVVPPRDFKVVFNAEGKIVNDRIKAGKKYKSDFRCVYCPFKDYCWAQPGAEADAVFIPMTASERESYKSKLL